MQEIKFRVWDKELQKYIDINNVAVDPTNGDVIKLGGYELLEVNHEAVLEQYAGFKDVNDVAIYAGDIVKLYAEIHDAFGFEITKQQTGRIYFVDGAFFLTGGTGNDPVYAYEDELEVIGNIHENPELLEEQ